MQKVEKFIFGVEKMPQWCHDQIKHGRVKIEYEDGVMIGAKVFGPTKTTEAKIGDTIAYSKSGLSVLPKAKTETREAEIKTDKKAVQ